MFDDCGAKHSRLFMLENTNEKGWDVRIGPLRKESNGGCSLGQPILDMINMGWYAA